MIIMPNVKNVLRGIENGWDAATGILHSAVKSGAVPLMRTVERSGGNYWLGLRPKRWVTGLAVGGIGAYTAGKALFDNKVTEPQQQAMANAEEVGMMPAMRYERTGYNLGASGDIVLGLNNMRRGR